MKAFLLAAGEGKRLRPITNEIPKCLVTIQGKPLVEIWLELLSSYNISEVLVNLHYLGHKVEKYIRRLGDYSGLNTDNPQSLIFSPKHRLNIKLYPEKKLLGSGSTILANKDFVRGEEYFFILYGDNLTNVNLKEMLDFHKNHGGMFTMGLFRTSRPKDCGIVNLGLKNLIVEFTEKPVDPKSNLANAGIYIASQKIFDYIPGNGSVDLSFNVLPELTGKMYGYVINDYILDIGSIENYEIAQKTWKGLKGCYDNNTNAS